MTKEADLLKKWDASKAAHLAWGLHVRETIVAGLVPIIAPVSISYFLKTVVEPRLKDDLKLVEKAFYRGKAYSDPFEDMTDKVGIRFVVLLGSDIAKVVQAVEGISDWTRSKDRDYELEQKKNPIEFGYAAVHFIVSPTR